MELRAADPATIRRLIDVSLDAAVLPDAVLQDDGFLGRAQDELLALDADAFGYDADTDEYRRAQRALSCLVAANVAPAVPVITGITVGDTRLTREKVDYRLRAQELRALAAGEVAAYLESAGVVDSPVLFSLAHGYRGR
jgi:hypothetical protein